MIINKLNDNFFFDFASCILGEDVSLYKQDLFIERNEDKVKLKVFLGGEMEDGRTFQFKDNKCVFKHCGCLNQNATNLSYEWVSYLLECSEDLNDLEKQQIVEAYNKEIQKNIHDYALKQQEKLII